MKKITIFTLAYSITFFVWSIIFILHTNIFTQIVFGVMLISLVLLAIIMIVLSCTKWRENQKMAIISLATSIFALTIVFIIVPRIGRPLRDYVFKHRLPLYEEVIQLIKNDKLMIDSKTSKVTLPDEYSHIAHGVFAQKMKDGFYIVEFITGRGFPVKHNGYLYCSKDIISENSRIRKRWPYISRYNNHWYRIRD